MSTRATILVKNEGITIAHVYHHYDGYPEGLGVELAEHLPNIKNWHPVELAKELVEKGIGKDKGFEYTTCIHGDEDFIYVIDCDSKSVKCYQHEWDAEESECVKAENEVQIPYEAAEPQPQAEPAARLNTYEIEVHTAEPISYGCVFTKIFKIEANNSKAAIQEVLGMVEQVIKEVKVLSCKA